MQTVDKRLHALIDHIKDRPPSDGPADRTPDEQEEMFEMFGANDSDDEPGPEEDDDGGGSEDATQDRMQSTGPAGKLLEAYERLSSSLLFTGESENFPESSEKMFRRLAFALEPARGVKKSLTHEV